MLQPEDVAHAVAMLGDADAAIVCQRDSDETDAETVGQPSDIPIDGAFAISTVTVLLLEQILEGCAGVVRTQAGGR